MLNCKLQCICYDGEIVINEIIIMLNSKLYGSCVELIKIVKYFECMSKKNGVGMVEIISQTSSAFRNEDWKHKEEAVYVDGVGYFVSKFRYNYL